MVDGAVGGDISRNRKANLIPDYLQIVRRGALPKTW